MADAEEESQLLFFDTFSKESAEELNLDLVNFPRPVIVKEVRVIPLGTRVQADVPGGVRLGATNPTSFKIEFFVNNLTKPDSAVFERLGVLEYRHNVDIQVIAEKPVPTDGLILKGWYSTITLAVYGVLTTVPKVRSSPPPPPPPQQPVARQQHGVQEAYIQPQPAEYQQLPPVMQQAAPQAHPDYPTLPQPVPAAAAPGLIPQDGHPPPEWDPQMYPGQQAAQVQYQQPPPHMTQVPAPHVEGYPNIDDRRPLEPYPMSPRSTSDGHTETRDDRYDDRHRSTSRDGDYRRESERDYPRSPPRSPPRRISGRSSRSPDRHRTRSRTPERRRSRTPDRRRSKSPRRRSRTPERRRSRTPERRWSRSPGRRSRSAGRRSRSPDRWRSRTPDRRGSRSQERRRSRSLERRSSERRRSRTPERRRSRTPDRRRSLSPRRRSRSPDFRKRSRTPERRHSRSPGRPRSRSPTDRRRSRSPTDRRRSRTPERRFTRSPRRRSRSPDMRQRSKSPSSITSDRSKEKGYQQDFPPRDRELPAPPRELPPPRDYPPRDFPQGRELPPPRDSRDFQPERELPPTHGGRDRELPPPRDRDFPLQRDLPPSRDFQHTRDFPPPFDARDRDFHGSRDRNFGRELPPPRDGKDQRDREFTGIRDEGQGRDREVLPSDHPAPPHFPPADMDTTEPVEPQTGELAEEIPDSDMFDALTPDMDQDDAVDKLYGNLSDGEIQDAEGEGYEEISSDEANLSDFDGTEIARNLIDWDVADMDDAWYDTINTFNPYQCDVTPLDTFVDPSLTAYEAETQKMMSAKEERTNVPQAAQIVTIIETYKNADHHDKWVEAMETLPSLVVPGLVHLIANGQTDVLTTLIDWTLEGLNLDKAMAQPETAYKVRHLKMGVMMAGVLCTCDSYTSFRMLKEGVQKMLIDLYESQYMSSSVKLQIIRALDSTTRFKDGMEWFLGRHQMQGKPAFVSDVKKEEETEQSEASAYQRMASIILSKQMVRSMVSLSALVRKTHFYEVLNKLSSTVDMLVDKESTPAAEKTEEDTADQETGTIIESIAEEEVEVITSSLDEITRVYVNAEQLIAQPRRTLPGKVKFEVTQKPYDPYPNLYHMLNSCRVLESVFVLLSSPVTCSHLGIFAAVKEFLMQLLSTRTGLLYLSSKPDQSNGIIRSLTQDYARDENSEDTSVNQLGLEMIYRLHALQLIDQLREYQLKENDEKVVDSAEAVGNLHLLYLMTFSPLGKRAVSYVLTLEDNLQVLLPFAELTGDEEKDGVIKKSVSLGYTLMLLILVVRNCENMETLEKFSTRLMNISDQEIGSNKFQDRLHEIQEWISPLRKISAFDEECIPELVTQLKGYSEDALDMPKGLAITLRVMKYLAVSPKTNYKVEEQTEELKYKYNLIELYSNDCFSMWVNILQKVSEVVLRPWQKGIPRSSHKAALLYAIIKPAAELVKVTLSHVIAARDGEFRDLTSLPCLFNLYTVICSVNNPSGQQHPDTPVIQRLILDAILTFTQPTLTSDPSEEALSNNLWTMMMKELFKYVGTAPYTFLGGLLLISELLPLPLPVQTREALTEEEVEMATNHRKMWSAHLHPLHGDIETLIKTLAGTSCQPLTCVLRRVCGQLADLAAPSALYVVRCLLDAITSSMDATISRYGDAADAPEQKKENTEEIRSSGQTARMLALVANLINQQASIKAAFLQICRPGEKYFEVLGRLGQLLNVVSEKNSHIQAQEAIVSIFQAMCDPDVTLITGEHDLTVQEQLANAVPQRDQLAVVCSGLLDHLGNRDHSYSSLLPAVRTLDILTYHDYGFFHVKQALSKNTGCLSELFMRINSTFSKDSSDCIATLSSVAEFIQHLVVPPEQVDEAFTMERSMVLTSEEVRQLLVWSEGLFGHPLDDVNMLLQEYAKEEEALKTVHESVEAVVQLLQNKKEETPHEYEEPSLPSGEPINSQFSKRATYQVVYYDDDDERLTKAYWFSVLGNEEIDTAEVDVARCDFEELVQKYCPDFDLKTELHKSLHEKDAPKARRKIRAHRKSDTINTSRSHRGGKFVAPMRGRGYGRPGMNSGGRHDPFRSRPPNTSRPPSMHVDDFIKMESQQNQQDPGGRGRGQDSGGPVGRRMDHKVGMRDGGGRGRGGFDRGGRGFGGGGRGRFFTPPGRYGQKDNQGRDFNPRGRGGGDRGRGGGRGSFRGNSPGPKGPSWNRTPRQDFGDRGRGRGFGRGDGRPASADRRGGKDRFGGGRGGRGGWMGEPRKDDRFMPPPQGFGRRDRGRHQRSFTK